MQLLPHIKEIEDDEIVLGAIDSEVDGKLLLAVQD